VQTLDSQLVTALDQDHEIVGKPIVIAEWNFNRLIKATAKNISDPNDKLWPYTSTHFPPSSLVEGFRPDAGMIYGFTGTAYPISDEQLGSGGKRYYYCDKDAVYKYWISPTPSQNQYDTLLNNSVPTEFSIQNSNLLVEYDSWVKANKVKVVFNGDVRPSVWRVSVFDKIVNNWVVIATSPTIDDITGRAEMWWDGSSWVQVQQLDVSVYREINKIRVEVDSLTTSMSRLELIEIAAMREVDLSDRVQNYSIESSMDDVDYIHPVGQMNSNDGSILLDNRDLEIDMTDPSKDYYGLMDGWCEYRTYIRFDMAKYGTSDKMVRTGTMYSNGWTGSNPYEFEIKLFDIVKIIQGIKCPAMIVENKTIARIMSMVLDLVGIDKYEFNFEDFDPTEKIKYFWTDGDESVYDVLNRLCKSYQCVMFTDEFGKLQLITRNQLVNSEDSESFTLSSESIGPKLPNIIDLSKKYDISINDVEIKYKQKEANIDATDITGKVLTSKVWDTSDSVVVRAAPLTRNLSASDVPEQVVGQDVPADLFLPSDKIETWPYSGKVNIDGEVFEYKGKGYAVINYQTGNWTEHLVYNDEEKRKWDKYTYDSYAPNGSSSGGTSGHPVPAHWDNVEYIIQNKWTGRLRTKKRAQEGSVATEHSKESKYGWAAYNVWMLQAGNPSFPGKYIEPTRSISLSDLRDTKLKPNWGQEQRSWSQKNSILSHDNMWKPQWDQGSILVKDLDDTEYREFGMRFRFTEGAPDVGLLLCLSSQDGYADDPFETDVTECYRFYTLNLHSTALIEAAGRQCNEVTMAVKNGDSNIPIESMTLPLKDSGKIQLDHNKWYDLDVVMNDQEMPGGGYRMTFEIFINGQYLDTFFTHDVIRPTNLFALMSRYQGKIDFESVYASTSTGFNRKKYSNEEAFGTSIIQLPEGMNLTKPINFPTVGSWLGSAAISVCSLTPVTIHSFDVYGWDGSVLSNLGPTHILAESRKTWVLPSGAVKANIRYSSTDELSVLIETSLYGNIPYRGYNDVFFNYPNDFAYWSHLRNGYVSMKHQHIITGNTTEFDKGYTNEATQFSDPRKVFHDDFGSIVREIREFDVEYSVAPAKGTRVYVSNPEITVLSHEGEPAKGKFRLINVSHQDQIANGNEQIDESNNIDHTLMIYGYVLIEKEEKTKRIKNEESIRRHGPYSVQLDAEWINSDDEAEALATWIVNNWGGVMDTIEVRTFLTVAAQIGDKAKIIYPDAQVDPNWLFIVSKISRDYDSDGFSTSLTLRRIR
jgi:hypothetical protein